MNTMKFFMAFPACAFVCAVAQGEEKTVSEKSVEVWDKTKKTVNAIEHKIDAPDADARKVPVTISDSGVQMPASMRSGKTAFIVTNSGKQKHNFEIEGGNLDKSI